MEYIKEVGRRIKLYREKLGVTQEQLIELAGIGATKTLSEIENGKLKYGSNLLVVRNIARALGINLLLLIGEEEDDIDNPSNEEDAFIEIDEKYDPHELSYFMSTQGATIDGIELNEKEARQIINFARFLVLQREDESEEILKYFTEFLKQRKA
ncbi:DNA-binding transcriptional regulator, XRE-family HTH domain [Paenibacillus sp. 1_12]|uniref:helix-turn-helix domain-containing protein n=1 Tax=Paenibacillus sp. 1_12 TaxID=1566278 RepID=UPI0008DF6113|nr:helix-turn-helix transcriptional regulator [Paenibacillus sp. 1_12]SFM12203.1 DNA-binding transcriptional regulator, XRE-family HTH domain [Paenibacillus sp. 1_12]